MLILNPLFCFLFKSTYLVPNQILCTKIFRYHSVPIFIFSIEISIKN